MNLFPAMTVTDYPLQNLSPPRKNCYHQNLKKAELLSQGEGQINTGSWSWKLKLNIAPGFSVNTTCISITFVIKESRITHSSVFQLQ